jgi:MiaB-like tRNA modifying enzyme
VKEPTEKKIERRIADLRKLNKPLIVAGCMPEVRSEKLQDKNLYLLGTHHMRDICKLIRKITEDKYNESEFLALRDEQKLLTGKISGKDKIGITQISEGCQGNCAYCIVKLAKGKLFSYDEDKILKNIQNDLNSGAKEIWITSQDNASYGLDKGERKLPDLLKKILELKGRFQLRIGMMNPENILLILDDLVEIYKHKKMKPFLHIPVQSGSDTVLKKMRRKYKIKDFLKIIETFRAAIPDLFLSTDIIVGFPGESEQDFSQSIELIEKIKPNMLNLSRFWSMKGTEAEKMIQLSVEVIKQRTKKLMDIYKQVKP